MRKRTITRMLWTFPRPIPLRSYVEDRGVADDTGPVAWKIECVIMSRDYEKRTGYPSGHLTFWILDRGNHWFNLENWLGKKLHDFGCPSSNSLGRAEPWRSFSIDFRAVKNENRTTTAIFHCRRVFRHLGVRVLRGPEISQHTQIYDNRPGPSQGEWIDFGQKLWEDHEPCVIWTRQPSIPDPPLLLTKPVDLSPPDS